MTFYAVFDQVGLPQSFYADDIFPPVITYGEAPEATEADPNPVRPVISSVRNPAIPAEAVEIAAAQHEEFCDNTGCRRWNAATATVVVYDPPPPPRVVPDNASRLGLMRALKEIGKWDAAKAAIASNADAQEEWDLAISIKRGDPLTAGIIQALGLTSADVDRLLIRAAALTT